MWMLALGSMQAAVFYIHQLLGPESRQAVPAPQKLGSGIFFSQGVCNLLTCSGRRRNFNESFLRGNPEKCLCRASGSEWELGVFTPGEARAYYWARQPLRSEFV
ncbi:hypothetical protein M011DRAFT_96411 [Sporormia fimetaria CBS 119925]|uniref:Uncharacterized protein n=1 Tax=Sporormia fimetaria CBS 119925 TaxID=1340428 RepID=A0A6A6V6C0_9PLEO|nr:hypothetical protein M011DRAFT_96411 [Sporormia fimetaria CBS 119925]